MADGLFSYQTPGQLQQEYLSNLIQPVGGGDLYSQLVQTMSNAGRMMGYGAGRMFGGQVPGEAKNAAIQSVFEQVKDIQDPAQQYTAASQLFMKAGFPDLAMQARSTAQKEQLTGYQLGKAKADFEEITNAPARRRAALEAKYPTLDKKQIEAVSNNKDLFVAYMTPTKPGESKITKVGLAEGTKEPVYVLKQSDGTFSQVVAKTNEKGEQFFVPYSGAVDQTTAKTSVKVGDKGQDEQLKTFGKLLGESQFNLMTRGVPQAKSKIAVIDQTIDILEQGKAVTGFASDLRNDVLRIKSTVFGDKKAAEKASASQLLNAFLGSEVFSLIGELGIGARGLDTPAEREFLREVFTGTRALEPEALLRLAKMRRRAQELVIQKYNNAIQQGQYKRYEKRFNLVLTPEQIPTRTSSKWGN